MSLTVPLDYESVILDNEGSIIMAYWRDLGLSGAETSMYVLLLNSNTGNKLNKAAFTSNLHQQ